MIRSIRRQHRLMIVTLAAALVLLFIAGLMARNQPPTNQQIHKALLGPSPGGQR